jgi:hypothetical protein
MANGINRRGITLDDFQVCEFVQTKAKDTFQKVHDVLFPVHLKLKPGLFPADFPMKESEFNLDDPRSQPDAMCPNVSRSY